MSEIFYVTHTIETEKFLENYEREYKRLDVYAVNWKGIKFACHVGGPGSIPGLCSTIWVKTQKYFCKWVNRPDFDFVDII